MIHEKCGGKMKRITIVDQWDNEPATISYAWVCEPCNYIYYEEMEVN